MNTNCPFCQNFQTAQPDMAACQDEAEFEVRQVEADARIAGHFCPEMAEAGF